MTNPLVSILIPAYNAEEWMAETIQSALNQTWPRKEIIVVDDGSSDETLAVARRFASREVSVIGQSNQGAAAARNKAFSVCQGDYIQWLDADDLLSPDKLSAQMEVRDHGRGDRTLLSSGWGSFMYRHRRAQFRPTALWCDLLPVEWLMRKMGQNLHMQTATWLVSRPLTTAAGPWDTRLHYDDDGEYFCRVLLASQGVRFVSRSRVFYRISGYGRLSYIGRSHLKMQALFISMRLHIGYLLSLENSERTREACIRYLQNWLLCFYPEESDIVREAERLAADLGGRLETPKLPWKYEYVRRVLGWGAAKGAQVYLPQLKWTALRAFDKVLFRLEETSAG